MYLRFSSLASAVHLSSCSKQFRYGLRRRSLSRICWISTPSNLVVYFSTALTAVRATHRTRAMAIFIATVRKIDIVLCRLPNRHTHSPFAIVKGTRILRAHYFIFPPCTVSRSSVARAFLATKMHFCTTLNIFSNNFMFKTSALEFTSIVVKYTSTVRNPNRNQRFSIWNLSLDFKQMRRKNLLWKT